MTEVTQFLAQLSGPVFLVVGLALLVNVSAFLKVAADAEKDDLENYLASIMLMVAGLAIVLYHNVWTDAPEVIISLLGWACLIKGIFWILL
ncbi:MAG: hypothetical protein NTZ80_04450, partial [Patescibacteria group bacterium]|nr:hypothetical protein [Patescibacteria group bacterium]